MKHQITCILFSYVLIQIGFSQNKTIAKADSLFYENEQPNGPGLAISVQRNGNSLYQNQVGLSNMEYQIPISDSSVFLVGSVSKQFTSFAILLLESEGKLAIDDPVTFYLPELKMLNKEITIRQLANHTSGFRNSDDLNELRGRSNQDLISNQEMVSVLLKQRALNFTPGERFQYVNSGYVLLAEIVKRVAGMPFSEYVKINILDPLEMNNSQFMDDPTTVIKNKVRSYYLEGGQYHYISKSRSVVGPTGLYTTSSDLIKWNQNLMDPEVGNEHIISKMISPSTLNSGVSIPYGLGQETKMYRGVKVVFHGGGDAGFRAYSLSVPQYGFTMAITGNFESFNPLNLAYGMIDVFLLNELNSKKNLEIPTYTSKELDSFTGDYQVFPGFFITIIAENDSLYFQSFGSDSKLAMPAVSINEFKFPDRPHSKMVFTENQLFWHFSDFSYPAKRVIVNPPLYSDMKISDYLGSFFSEELETTYTFIQKDGKVIVTHPFHPDIELKPIGKDAFISDVSFLGRVHFTRNEKNSIVGCQISGQTAYQNAFVKRKFF
ncbi:MAG: CubicO group peptidase (beta-lactamase class C family) [Salibacteraceae bacterium]|jgi:CubicO group peptidase (beta-lactamase class C family)